MLGMATNADDGRLKILNEKITCVALFLNIIQFVNLVNIFLNLEDDYAFKFWLNSRALLTDSSPNRVRFLLN